MKKLKAIDLCCGAGGWAFAARRLPIEFIAVVDIAADCLETWRTNHAADHPNCGGFNYDLSDKSTIEKITNKVGPLGRTEQIDLILGGIPCEQISVMRQVQATQKTMDEWHSLLDNCLEIVKQLRPRAWCFEDVIQIEKHLPLPLFGGGEIPVWRCDSSNFGPQRRIRSFIGEFPRPEAERMAENNLGECLLPGPHITIPHNEDYERLPFPGRAITLLTGQNTARVLSTDAPSPTVLGGGPHRGHRQKRNWMVEDSRGRLRILSFQEFAKLQGFPEDALFACGACRAQEMVGQAIPIYVGRAILKAICKKKGI